jgi:hypothetical protein
MAEQVMIPLSDVPTHVEKQTGWKPSMSTVRDWANEGKIRSRKIGGRIFVELDSVFGLFTRKEGQDR